MVKILALLKTTISYLMYNINHVWTVILPVTSRLKHFRRLPSLFPIFWFWVLGYQTENLIAVRVPLLINVVGTPLHYLQILLNTK